MLDSIQTVILERAINASAVRHKAIAGNIANVNTPGYKSKQVVFEDLLQKELSNKTLNLVKTNSRHLGGEKEFGVQPFIYQDNSHSFRTDGNNVDIDHETASMAKNQIYYSALTQQMSRYFNNVKSVINGR